MSDYNTESALARLIRAHYTRGQDGARALMREAFTLPAALQITDKTLHARFDPASLPDAAEPSHPCAPNHYPGLTYPTRAPAFVPPFPMMLRAAPVLLRSCSDGAGLGPAAGSAGRF